MPTQHKQFGLKCFKDSALFVRVRILKLFIAVYDSRYLLLNKYYLPLFQ